MKQSIRLKTAAVLGGLALSALVLLIAEITVRVLDLQPPQYVPPTVSRSALNLHSELSLGSSKHIPVHLPKAHDPSPQTDQLPTSVQHCDINYAEVDPIVGLRPKPNTQAHCNKKKLNGSNAYDAVYTIDRYRRRVTPGQETGTRSRPLLFLGCSFTYGQGLHDGETLPSQVARLTPDYRVYNYAFEGWGPNNLLRLVQTPDFAADIVKTSDATSKGKAVYVFIDNHLNRVVGALDIYRASTAWPGQLPYYYLDSNGTLMSQGMESDGRPVIDLLYRLLSQSRLLTWQSVELPPSFNEDHLRLFVGIISGIRDTLRKKLNGMELTVVFDSGSALAPALIPLLDAEKIGSLDYSSVDPRQYIDGQISLPDGHPSAETNRFLARQIVSDLNLKE